MSNLPLRLARGLAIFLAFYALIGFFIVPGVALRIANQQLALYATEPARLERLEFNPFRLTLDLYHLRIGDTETPQLAFEFLHVDLEWRSLWQRTLHLAEVRLVRPHTEVLFDAEGKLNLSRLFAFPASKESPKPVNAEPSRPFPLRIDRLLLERGLVHFQDRRPGETVDFTYDPLDLELHNLRTRSDDEAEAQFVAQGPAGGTLHWRGQLHLLPFRSSGHLELKDLRLASIWPYVQENIAVSLRDGVLNAAADYRLDLAEGTQLTLANGRLRLAPFAVQDLDGQPRLNLEHLDIQQASLDLAAQRLEIGQLRSAGLETWAAREADGEIDWLRLLKADGGATEQDPTTEGRPWQILLNDAQLRGYRAHLTDRATEQPVELLVGPLDLDVRQFDSSRQAPFQLRLDSGLGEQGRVHAEGEAGLQPLAAQLAVTLQAIDLRVAEAYLSPYVRLELLGGELAGNLDVQVAHGEQLALQVRGQASVQGLHTRDTLRHRDLLKWQALRLDGLDYRHGEQLHIEGIELEQPYARLIIQEDLSTNLNELIVEQPTTAEAGEATSANEPPLGIHVGGIAIRDGSANFADFSLRPNFATAIQQLNGRIGTLDNRSKQAASVDITGKVDRYAPVTIKGRLTPFDPLHSLDIATVFKQVELTTLTPYSGKFAGYRIRRGRLNLDLHYRIDEGRLNAENHVLLENLQLGERVDSDDAVDLPVRLAVALLKDTKGNIDIALPVQGDLNDPQFSVMPIIWQTLRNLVLRAVQAPFKFVAGLVGGSDEDLDRVPFEPGSSVLGDAARQRLDTLAAALRQRPQLRLEVEGASAVSADGPLLAERRLQREYRQLWYNSLQRRGQPVPATPDDLEIDEDLGDSLLQAIYRSQLGQPPASWAELADEQIHDNMRQALLARWSDSPTALRRLAQERAASIKAYLVDQGGLEDKRIYLLDSALVTAGTTGSVETPLHLDSQ